METILVTGGAGFIGSHTNDKLLELGNKVICLDNFNDYYSPVIKRKNIAQNLQNPNFFLVEGDICAPDILERIFSKYQPKVVIHLAARAGVRGSIKDPKLYYDTNVNGTLNLLESARKHGIKKIVFGSSSSVYGINSRIPFSENSRTDAPVSPYAATKKAGEVLCHAYNYLYKLDIICLRFFTVYGPRGRPDMAPYIFLNNIWKGLPITVYGDGTTVRDYTYVHDVVTGIISAVNSELSYEVINIGNSSAVSLSAFIEIIEKLTNKKAVINHKPLEKADVPNTYADLTKAKKMLDFHPTTNIMEGMKIFFQWYKKEVDT